MQTLTYVYDDTSPHPERPVSAIQSPGWTPEDHALVLGLAKYEDELCRCGFPKTLAWHSEMDGWFECDTQVDQFVCHACTARNDGKQVTYVRIRNTRPDDQGEIPPFVLGTTTTAPDPPD
jgi:hypothetical protein